MQATQAVAPPTPRFTTRAIEAGWLAAAVLIPVAVSHDSWMIGFIQMPKVFLLRTIALFLLAAMTLDWALRPPVVREEAAVSAARPLTRLWLWGRAHPARWILLAVAAVLAANLISLAFSPVRSIGLTGVDPGWDTYGLFSVASYAVLFLAISLHMRTQVQLRRFMWAITAASMLVSLYAIWQHFGLDPFRTGTGPAARAQGPFGNPIFLGSFLVLSIPLTLGLFLPYRDRMSTLTHIWLGAALISLQTTALLFSLSRGPWIAFFISMSSLLVLAAWLWGTRDGRLRLAGTDPETGESFVGPAVRFLAMLLVAGGVSMILNLVPVIGNEDNPASALGERVTSIAPDVGGGLNNRLTIWRTATEAYFTVPWVDTERFPELPELGARPLRPIVGYGPDMFQYAYPLVGESTYTFELASHGHNFVIHTMLELGLLGVLAYAGLAAAVGFALLRMLRRAHRGEYPFWVAALLVGVGAALMGRLWEQIPGKAQVSDLSLSWMLAGVVVAMISMRFGELAPETPARPQDQRSRQRRARRGQAAGRQQVQDPLKIAAASVVAVFLLFFWVIAVVPPVRAAFVVKEGGEAEAVGELDVAARSYVDAGEIQPTAAITQLRLAQVLFASAQNASDQNEQTELLDRAMGQLEALARRNPLDHRLWSRAAEIQRERSIIAPNLVADPSYNSQLLTALLPGFWQSQAGLAFTYTRLNEPQLALEAIQNAKELSETFSEVGDLNILHFVEALALQALGQEEEAIAAATRSMELALNLNACKLLLELGATEVVDSFNVSCE